MKKVIIVLLFLALSFSFLLIIPKVILARNKAQHKKTVISPTPVPLQKFHTKAKVRRRFSLTPTPILTQKPQITPTKILTPTTTRPSHTVQPESSSNLQESLLSEVNAYRSSKGLSQVKSDPYTCSFAKTRAQEITTNFSHDGFTSRINSNTLPYPSYHEVTENIAMTSDYKQVVKMWINSPGHAANMEKDTPYVCVASSGNYYAYVGWRP